MDVDDDDWLRSRTSRLLDLLEPEDLPIASAEPLANPTEPLAHASAPPNSDAVPELDPEVDPANHDGECNETPDPTMEAIRTNGRLFVRNLPYSATEEDLRRHFEPYGSLEDVRQTISLCLILLYYDEYPDRDSLCLQACDVNWTRILVDASCFLKIIKLSLPAIPLRFYQLLTRNADPPSLEFRRHEQRVSVCTGEEYHVIYWPIALLIPRSTMTQI